MNDHDDGTESPATFEETFQAMRPRLLGVAYGLLGSLDEAEDVVQDAWLRLRSAEAAGGDEIRDVTGWLVVTVSRLALDVLRSARRRREEYVGPWLPEPVLTGPVLTQTDPAERVTLDESMSMAMLVVLESLSPAERTAFVLHDVFGLTFAEVGEAVGRSPAACRQLAARARAHVASRAPRFDVDPSEHRRVVDAFARACLGDDMDALVALLDPDVVLRSDGGGRVRAGRRPVSGAAKVARLLSGIGRFGRYELVPAVVNGWPGLLRYRDGRLVAVIGLTVAGGRITAVDMVLNPEKLARVTRADETRRCR
ncbi:RNA polymerase sigma factor SigJ [Microbispora hainanensis]|uniref:RNA polymerase sigma factor SigJ n=1 Tax=Microbispora hainanensis TaxID=568844 RepID=UPI001FCBF1C7|nr:RNA polymerase sigma factor SigJ [Microbispora hainanensis]